MDDEGADQSPSEGADEAATDTSDAVDDPESDGSEDAPDTHADADTTADETDQTPTDGEDAATEDPAAAADEQVSDGPYGAEAEADGAEAEADGAEAEADGAETEADGADEGEGEGAGDQSDLEPAGDPEEQWGPREDEEWEDPFPDIEAEPPTVEHDEEGDAAYPANPNVPERDASFDDSESEEGVGAAGGNQGGRGDHAGGAPGAADATPAQPTGADEVTGSVAAQQTQSDGGYADPTSTTVDDGLADGPASDQEMPLADHIEEMVRRLGVVIVVLAVIAAVVFPFAERVINFLWFSYLPGSLAQCPANPDISQGGAACARVYNPLALIFARLKMASLAGLVVSLPVFVYETYLFMRPGLYPTERRYYLASVPTSLVLAGAGVAFAHFLVLPAIFTYFVFYSEDATVIAFGLTETFDLMVLMLGGFAIIFQIPLFVSLALMMGIVTRRWMATKRLYFWGAFAGLAFLFSPDPTGMAPIIVAATMIVLFEGTLLLAKWTGRE
jgi:sec-independent protein translocase protein TatC